MSDLIEQNLWNRMRHTPLSDAVRGRITGRLNWRRRVRASALPQPLKDLVLDVARRTRLWRIERAAVADELIGHFEDGLAAGETSDALIERFGDRAAAAKLIGRSMRRKRSIVWQVINALRWLCVTMIVFYAISAAYFFAGKPNVRRNYIAEINQRVTAAPEDQRAWPLYRNVLPQLELDPKHLTIAQETGPVYFLDLRPGEAHWDELKQWLVEHQAALALAREATAKPAMGFTVGPNGSAYDIAVWPSRLPAEPEQNPLLLSIILPHLDGLRRLADIFAADVRLAHEQDDGDRIVRDIDAMCGIADQLVPDSVLVQQLVAVRIRETALTEFAESLPRKPSLLSAGQLQHLAHRFARPASAPEMFDPRLERAIFYDVIQRAYTDDGHGDGRLTPEGARLADQLVSPSKQKDVPIKAALMATPPALLASRREVVSLYDRWMDLAEANLHRPAREAVTSPFEEEFVALGRSPVQQVRYALLLNITPSLSNLSKVAERYLGQRDGLLIGIALELYRREHSGAYPSTLEVLAPTLLPSVPVDRITGGPPHYRVVNGKPRVYSVGADLDDDGGVTPKDGNGRPDPLRAAEWHVAPNSLPIDGDWVLFPANAE